MILQWLLVALIVTACAAYLARSVWRAVRGKPTGCGCSSCPAATSKRDR